MNKFNTSRASLLGGRVGAGVLLLLASLAGRAEQVRVYTTTADGKKQMEYTTSQTLRAKASNHITLRPATSYQEMDGFGYAITYSACYNLLKMSAEDRRAFLIRTFSRTAGYGVSYARISIGCSDFSSTEYTLCDKEGLENFRLHQDETKYVIPVLKEILAINPDLKIMAAPWTCPKWMKIKSLNDRVGYDSWTSGTLNPAHYETYAQYFVKFVQTFAAEGIPIYAVTPQNEPLNRANSASLYMPWDEEAAFVNHLAPAFAHAGITTKIYCFDHNYNYDNIASQQDYPIGFYNALDPDMDGRELVVGSAWHDYGGSPSELDDINQKAPDKEVIFTESSIGTWNDGRNLATRLLADAQNLFYGTVTRQSKAVMVWNFMLDLNRGPNLDGGCQTCYGAVDIDQNDYHTLSYNSHYYVMAHASLAAHPGAKRIAASLSGSASGVSYVCFQNPDDDSYGAVVFNTGSSAVSMSMSAVASAVARFTVPAKSLVTVVMGGPEEKKPSIGGKALTSTKQLGQFRGTIEAEQLQSLSQNFIDDPALWHIDRDFLWPSSQQDGDLTFLPLAGKYDVEVDLSSRTLLCAPAGADLSDDGQGNIYICGPAKSIGRVFFYPGTETLPQNAIAMAEMEDGLYQYTLEAGRQLNDAAIDMAFFTKADLSQMFSGKTTADVSLTYDRTLGNSLFTLGRGALSHPDGHIYKTMNNRHLTDGTLWTVVVDIRGGLKGATVYIKEAEEPTGITEIQSSRFKDQSDQAVYDLQGRRLTNSLPLGGVRRGPGIYIVGGRKVVR